MRTLSKCLALVLAVAALGTAGGCAKQKTTARVATTANWNSRVSASVEKNYLPYWQSHVEVSEYKLTYKPNNIKGFRVEYDCDNATYVTRFYAESAYDWTAAAIPEEYRSAEALTEPVYVLETSLKMSGAFTSDSSTEKYEFTDTLDSVCKFRLAGDNLQPVYSKQIIDNTAPNSIGTNNLQHAYVHTDSVFETFYNRDCTSATTVVQNNLAEDKTPQTLPSVKVSDKAEHSLFDNSQIRAAMRAFTLSANSNKTFNVYTPQSATVDGVTAAVGTATALKEDDEEQAAMIAALDNCKPDDYIFFDGSAAGEEAAKTYRYSPVTLTMNASMPGPSTTMWYTALENQDVNATRCVMLRMTSPTAFGMGTLVYSLKALNVETK